MKAPFLVLSAAATILAAAGSAHAQESATAATAAPAPASTAIPKRRVVEAQIDSGPSAIISTWPGDRAIASSLRLGLRFADLLAVDTVTKLGYANVDDRVLTYLSLGATIYARIGSLRPFARLALVHQHEESRAAIEEDKMGAAFGVGNGIRHRGGFAGGLGLEAPVARARSGRSELVLGADANTTWFPDNRGPGWYIGANAFIGGNFTL